MRMFCVRYPAVVALTLQLVWPTVAAAAADSLSVSWQHHHKTISYVGLTTLYVCDSLERQVKRILQYLGARNDMKVTASCSEPVLPTRQALIEVDFFSLTLAEAAENDVTTGRWESINLRSGQPKFIDAGDCDLIQDMKELVMGSLTPRNLDYSTSCFPNALTLHDFEIRGQVLKVTPTAAP